MVWLHVMRRWKDVLITCMARRPIVQAVDIVLCARLTALALELQTLAILKLFEVVSASVYKVYDQVPVGQSQCMLLKGQNTMS